MERAMGFGVVPDDGEYCIDGLWTPGRQVRAQSARGPVAWITDRACHSPGLDWVTLGKQSPRTGLQPFLLSGLNDRGTLRPWDNGEFSEPVDTSRIDGINVAQFLEGWWDGEAPGENEYEQDEELQAMFAPFGVRFPGLAPMIDEPLGAELMRRALRQYTRDARIGLVPASRPADVLPRLGWDGACNSRTSLELAAVLRSWEDRFGARLLEVGFADIRLLVSRPPRTLEAAQAIAAEHFAFCDEGARMGLRGVSEIAPVLVGNPFWDFWWD
jgi:hypothetical protein